MQTRYFFAAILVLSGAVCISASAVSGTQLASAYVAWSAAKAPDATATEDGFWPGPRFPRSALSGAPISILGPVLIWLAAGSGVILILLGLWTGLRDVRQTGIDGSSRDAST